MSNAFWRTRVYYEDTDAGGVVYYANYLRFAERARTEWLRSLGFNHAKLLADEGMFFVVRRVEADYQAPARLDDLLRIETEIVRCGAATLDMTQVIRLEESGDPVRAAALGAGEAGKILVELNVKLAAVTADGKVCRLPPALREACERNCKINQGA